MFCLGTGGAAALPPDVPSVRAPWVGRPGQVPRGWDPTKRESGRPDSNRRRSAWKADALPTELLPRCWWLFSSRCAELSGPRGGAASVRREMWRVMDSNHRRQSRQIYSLLPLATRATLQFNDSKHLRYARDENDDELTRGLEPLTTCLQNRCSAIELRQPSRRTARRNWGRVGYSRALLHASSKRAGRARDRLACTVVQARASQLADARVEIGPGRHRRPRAISPPRQGLSRRQRAFSARTRAPSAASWPPAPLLP